jgi:hypothetical protein
MSPETKNRLWDGLAVVGCLYVVWVAVRAVLTFI